MKKLKKLRKNLKNNKYSTIEKPILMNRLFLFYNDSNWTMVTAKNII